jgi:outer membrane receptor for ferrienterochelin and colicins
VALFAQDEWDVTPQWSGYLGLRWEGIRTSDGNGAPAPASKTPAASGARCCTGLAHSRPREGPDPRQPDPQLQAPALNDLIAVPSLSRPTTRHPPDRSGNPDLKPELATGLDLAYEHYLGKSGLLSASGFIRNIDDLMRRETAARTGRRPALGVDADQHRQGAHQRHRTGSQVPADRTVAGAPLIDLRSNYSRFWSRVDGIPGPEQPPRPAAEADRQPGPDYRMKGVPLTVGASLNWTPETLVQTTRATGHTGTKRQFDFYGLWKLNAMSQLRLSANNLLRAKTTPRAVTRHRPGAERRDDTPYIHDAMACAMK